jgi:hypothetical protein
MCRLRDFLKVFVTLVAFRRRTEHKFCVSTDGCQQVIEIMRDASCQQPDRFHFL